MRPDWDEYFLLIAKIVSSRSTCNSRPTGAVIVKDRQILATGYNGSVPGGIHCIDQQGADGLPYCFRRASGAPEHDKYNYCRASHAEANAIAQAAQVGIAVEGGTLYATLAPCYSCLKLLSVARITHVYYEYDYESTDRKRDEFWRKMIQESGIKTFQQIRLSDRTLDNLAQLLRGPTSVRRIQEKEDMAVFDSSATGTDNEQMTTVYRKALFNTLRGEATSGKLYGPVLQIKASPCGHRQLEESRRRSGLDFLKKFEILDGETISDSIILKRLSAEIVSGKAEATVSKDGFSIASKLSGTTLDLAVDMAEVDLVEDYPDFLCAFLAVYDDLYMNCLDHYDISLGLGEVSITVHRPYLFLSAEDEAKKRLLACGESNQEEDVSWQSY